MVPQRPAAGAPALGAYPRPRGKFAPHALLCTDREATFAEARRHLGLEPPRQWSELAIRRATPAVRGLVSLVTLLAHRQLSAAPGVVRQAAWYRTEQPTFADALALVRRELWGHQACCTSCRDADVVNLLRATLERLTDTLCYAA